ncbi:sialic acid-binding Ig-like lectin 13 [Kryptolebias marmoratus]|uniref:sialic acid-binding Ig-like lectin 13 n=1 Tax=Kryptolebias marmoratus TaxID=37003 RepID=UPI0007F90566|nr:sialic acid-binding Ig-like lectin 13 [Kryptolebias marmoratus]XP_017259940.1 sialic acid-binding Ig-like lectin 13 [Kryptolebias marmoratus]XP_037829210.1 sialic acid-binding Ig-like lectin 13 [Kryptolebias marmoratus]
MLVKVMINIMSLSFLLTAGTSQAGCPNNILLFITVPKPLEALSGSCLHVPCSFRAKDGGNFDGTKSVFGVWLKNGQWDLKNTVFNSSKSVNIYPMNITGDLKQKDCSTLFFDLNNTFTDSYYFRYESESFKATAACNSLQITVTDSAWSPSIKISGGLKDLKEKESVSITCSAWTPCPHSPPELTWNLQQDSQKTEKNPDGTFTTKIQETITLSDTHDGSNISCSVRYPVDGGKRNETAETNLPLSVSYAPKDTSASISPSGLVSPGSWVELSCSSRAKPPVRTFTWFRNTTDGPVNVSDEKVYVYNVTEGGEFYCVATNDLGNQTSAVIHLKLGGSLDKSLPWGPIVGGIVGAILLILLILIIVCLRRRKKRSPSVQQLQDQTSKEDVVQNPTKETEAEEIHYGEFKFSNQASEPPSTSSKELDTVYAQVKVSETANPSTQTAERPEDFYAQVKVSETANPSTQTAGRPEDLYAQVKKN